MAGMPMRDDCKHFESRTYGNGERADEATGDSHGDVSCWWIPR